MQEKESLTQCADLSKHNSPIGGEAFISNQLDSLTTSFLENFKKSLRSGCLRQIVIVPSNVIKNGLIQRIKNEENGFLGVRFLSLPQAVEHAMKLILKASPNFPHHHNIMLFLDSAIKELIEESPEKFPAMTNFVKRDSQARLSLAEHLSHTFLFYGLYGGEALTNWEKKTGWQQYLFKKTKEHWDYPYMFSASGKTLSVQTHFHLFNLPTIPELYRNLFDHIGATFYHRTPTPHYVEDVLADRSLFSIDQKLQREEIALASRAAFHSLAKEPNRLFANLAKATLSMTSWIQDKEPHASFTPSTKTTQLAAHQNLIFDLSSSKLPVEESDSSIEVHAAPSRIREVEVVLARLTSLFSQNPSLKCSDVAVFAPNMETYAAIVEFVFGQKSSPFGYIVTDICAKSRLSTSSMIATFFHLAQGRFHPKEIFTLITSPCCNKPTNLKDDDIKLFWPLFEKLHVQWGYDKEMREEILGTSDITEKGTFKDAFDKLLSQLSFISSPVELATSEQFGELIVFIERIATDLRDLKHRPREIGDWIETMTRVVTDYFVESDAREGFIKEMVKLSTLKGVVTEKIPFTSMLKIVDEITLGKEERIADTSKPPILFSSIGEGKIPSPRVTFLLGMDEDAFPRGEMKRSIDEIKGDSGANYRPTITEKDKLFFFEAIAYTLDHLIISYTHSSESDGKELFTSLLVEDLMARTPNLTIQSHPPLPFAKEAFENLPLLPSMEPLAKAHYFPKDETLHKQEVVAPPTIESVDLSELVRLNTHPIRFFMQKRMGIYLEGEDVDLEREMREFMLSYRMRSQIRNQAYLEPREEVEKEINENSLLPTALFSIAAKAEIKEQIDEANNHLQALGLSHADFITVILDPAVDKPTRRNEGEYLHPPVQIGETMIYGRLDLVTEEGLFTFGDKSTATLWKAWPKLLILNALKSFNFPSKLIFAKDCETIPVQIKDYKRSIEKIIEYYLQSLQTPSPLMPERVKTYGKKEIKSLGGGLFKDPYLEALNPDLTIDWSSYIEEVHELL